MLLASASTIVKFHDFPSGNVVHIYQPGTKMDGPVRSISWSKDGNWLALVPFSGLVEIISVKDHLKLIHTIQGIEEPSCASFQNTTKKNIAVGTKIGQVLIYDIKSKNVKKRFPRITSEVTKVEFTIKDSYVVAACENGEIFLFNIVQNNLSGTFRVPRSQTINCIKTSFLKNNYVVAGSNEGVVAVWDIHTNKNKYFIGSHNGPVTDVAFSPSSSDLIVSTGLDKQFCFYDITENKCIGNVFVENSMTSVDFSPDGQLIVMASQTGQIHIYDPKNIQLPAHSFFGHNRVVEHLKFQKSEDYECSLSVTSGSVSTLFEEDTKLFPFHSPAEDLMTATDINKLCPIFPPLPDSHTKDDSESFNELIRTTVKEELKTVTEELKNEMKYYSSFDLSQMRQMSLGLLMHSVKEFIKIENTLKGMVPQNQSLLQENAQLKLKIIQLEEEIILLKSNHNPKTASKYL